MKTKIKSIVKTIAWSIRHPKFALNWLRHGQPWPYFTIITLAFLVGCSSFNTTTFRTEKAVGDTARGAVHAWNQYYPVATSGASVAECQKLAQEQTQIYDASRKLGSTLQVVDNLRLAYAANAANTNLTALQIAIDTATSQSGAILELVKTFMASTSTK